MLRIASIRVDASFRSAPVTLLPSEWALKTFTDKNEDWIVSGQPFPPPVAGR